MKLGLGTVQLGQDYGIANITGKPGMEAALEMLSYAYDNGVNFFDTAAAYGDSELVIGEFIDKRGIKDINICTKGLSGNIEFCENQIINEVEKSLDSLKLKKIRWYLLHNSRVMRENGDMLSKLFTSLKKRGIIDKFGISIYNPIEARLCLEYDVIDILQLPFNILDTRQTTAGTLEDMKKRGIEIHARSIYLQGALVTGHERISKKIPGLTVYTEKLRNFAETMGLSVKQLAFLFVRGNKYIDGMIAGCESLPQIEENIELFNMKEIDIERIGYFVEKEFSSVPEEIINPTLWK